MCTASQIQRIFPYQFSEIQLDNGLTIILVPMKTVGIVAYYTVVRTGSRDELEPGRSGFAHLFEHLMFRGTKKYPGNLYDKIIASLGAYTNAYTSGDMTVFHLNFSTDDLEKVIELESDRFQNLNYSEQEFKTESSAVYGEYKKGKINPWSVAFEKLHDMAFIKHTYKHTTVGFEEDIRNMQALYDYSISFYKNYYRPENTTIVIAGDIIDNGVVNLMKEYYSDWKPGFKPLQIISEPIQETERSSEVIYPGKTLPLLTIAYKADAFNLKNKSLISSVLLSELIFGETSEIFRKLVLKEQKVQFIQADFGFSRDPKLLYIYTMIKDQSAIDYVKNEIYNAIRFYQENPVDNKRLENLKKREQYSFLMNMNTPDNVAGFISQFIGFAGGIGAVNELYFRLNKITPQDLITAANYYFTPQKRNVILVKEEKYIF